MYWKLIQLIQLNQEEKKKIPYGYNQLYDSPKERTRYKQHQHQ